MITLFSKFPVAQTSKSAVSRTSKSAPRFEFSNDEFTQDTPESVAFLNEAAPDAEGWAMLAPFGDFPGRGVMVENGRVVDFPGIQRVDKPAAEAIVAEFNNVFSRLKRWLFGLPIFYGHPDSIAPNAASRYPDKKEKGIITALAIRDNGLFCRPAFNNDGAELLSSRKLCFSTRWETAFVADENGKKIFRPIKLKSAGLVERGNLPVEYLNRKEDDMNKQTLIALLQKLGCEIANDAADEQVTAAIESLAARAATFANDKAGAETKLKEQDGVIASLTSERDLAKQAADKAAIEFANERTARVTDALDLAITGGRITAAERPDWERRLKADFVNELPALAKLAPKIKTQSVTAEMGGRKIEMANAADRADFIGKAVDQVCAELHLDRAKDYNRAFAEVQKRFPAVFAAMTPQS